MEVTPKLKWLSAKVVDHILSSYPELFSFSITLSNLEHYSSVHIDGNEYTVNYDWNDETNTGEFYGISEYVYEDSWSWDDGDDWSDFTLDGSSW